MGLSYLPTHMRRALGTLTPPDQLISKQAARKTGSTDSDVISASSMSTISSNSSVNGSITGSESQK